MRILVKFPSRERAFKWHQIMEKYIAMSSKQDVRYFVTLDSNDPKLSIYKSAIELLKDEGADIECIVGNSEGKIHACNRDMEQSGEWDIVVLASDDMIPVTQNWDVILRNEMQDYYPDTGGVLYHSDGFTKLNTMCIIGRKYFDRFGYIYHPSYKSLWCDNEFMEVADILGKQQRFEQVLFRHEHYSNGPQFHHTKDALMNSTESFYNMDGENYKKRKALNFGL